MATSYLSPGVYVEEVDRGSKPIEAVGTNTVGFLGESSKGPQNEAVLVTNWSQFVKTFGDFKECSEHFAHGVYGFFNNGGSRCFVVNVGAPEGGGHKAAAGGKDDKKDDKAPAATGGGGRDGLYIGRDGGPGARTGLKCFDEVDEIAIVAAPGQTSPAVADAILSHCETRKDRFAILDSPETINGGVDKLPRPRDSKYGAYYFPWIQVYDPDKGHIHVPPSGHIAGVYSRVDSERGVHKAPANEIVRGALGLRYNVSKGEQDLLNPKGVNCIRFMSGAIRIWGARTLSSDPSWRYINVRRLFIMVESSIERATQWVVFEPNDHRLWKRVGRTITSFLTLLWRNGALMGTSPEQAFYVKCDSETNPPEVVDAGQLVVEIGLAPVKPAEFVIFRIGQMASGGGVEE
ncbi:MAG: phage tail sheath family protein [Kofleriaceae bacterium]|nr:phage tail sheath family protein [Myxococcales bacterium]MCB9561014.1 phage tail sheath family protein [Kofleriaceae bacterium]MCB9574520.1 phage tail sheath family protein [Kofleriaceae bacterium]